MVRNIEQQLEHRKKLREQLFEDQNYRKWSDVVAIDSPEYEGWRDDCLFECYLRNTRFNIYDLNLIEEIFQHGDSTTINWQNLYDYFDTQLNDKDNRYKREINYFRFYPGGIGASNTAKGLTIMQILDKYRDQILRNQYDII